MTSRERVIAALNHRQPDRCPIDIGCCAVTGMNVSTMYRLRKALGLDAHRLKAVEPFQMLGEVEDDLREAVCGDVVGLWNRGNMMGFDQSGWKPFDLDDGTPALIGAGFAGERNERGDILVHACGDPSAPIAQCMPRGGSFFDNVDHSEPFDMDMDESEMTPREDFKKDFQVASDEDARYWEAESRRLFEETECAVLGALGGGGLGDVAQIPGPGQRNPKGIRKIADWVMAQSLYPDYVGEVFEYQTEVMLKNLEIYRQAVGERIQIVYFSGTDFGTQHGPFISLKTFRSLYKPFYQKMNDWVHRNTGWKIFYHTCGCVNAFLDDFAEMGVDCLNPVQFSAMEPEGFGPERLKKEYGDKFVFWGGGVDTQRVLPFGSPEEVREQVAERVRILNRDGGYVFNTIHNVVAGVPVENLIAMYETVSGETLLK